MDTLHQRIRTRTPHQPHERSEDKRILVMKPTRDTHPLMLTTLAVDRGCGVRLAAMPISFPSCLLRVY